MWGEGRAGAAAASATAAYALAAEGGLFANGASLSALDLASGSLKRLVRPGMANMGRSTPSMPTPLQGEKYDEYKRGAPSINFL